MHTNRTLKSNNLDTNKHAYELKIIQISITSLLCDYQYEIHEIDFNSFVPTVAFLAGVD